MGNLWGTFFLLLVAVGIAVSLNAVAVTVAAAANRTCRLLGHAPKSWPSVSALTRPLASSLAKALPPQEAQ